MHYAHYVAIAKKLGIEAAVTRCRAAFCSHILSREFGETMTAFLARSERAQELQQFLADHDDKP